MNEFGGRQLVALKTWRKTESGLATVSLNGNLAILQRFLRFCETTEAVEAIPLDLGRLLGAIFGVAIIAGLAGLFLMYEARDTDGRLAVVGYRARQVIVARFGVFAVITLVTVGVSVGVVFVDFWPEQLWWFDAAMLVLSLAYGLVGMLVGALSNRLAGLWIVLILPMIDIGLFQDPLFVQSAPEWWMKLFPGYHPVCVMADTGLTTDLDTAVSLGWGFGYLLVVGLLAVWVDYRGTRTTRRRDRTKAVSADGGNDRGLPTRFADSPH